MVNHQTRKETDLIFSDFRFGTGAKESDFVRGALRRVRCRPDHDATVGESLMSRQHARLPVVAALLVSATIGVDAQEVELSGYVAGEVRTFFQTPQFADQLRHLQVSLLVEPELSITGEDGRHEFRLTPFARLDGSDDERTHVDLLKAFWRGVFGDVELLVGANVVFWGVTESRHLVNIINQTDFREDIDEEDKLGQPMVNLEWQQPWGRLNGFVLIGFREQPFVGADGRLRFPLLVAEKALFPDGERAADYAVRYSHFIGDFDIGVHLFHGTGRDPSLVFSSDATELIPRYRTITQVGLDLQYTRDAWLWKLEAISRAGEGRAFGAFVGGFEHTRYQILGSAADLGFLGEYLYDGRDADAPPTAFENDGFLGARLALNDTQDTTVLAGAVVDLEDGTVAARVEAERRLTDRLRLEVESRLFSNTDPGNLLHAFRRDSFVAARLSLFF